MSTLQVVTSPPPTTAVDIKEKAKKAAVAAAWKSQMPMILRGIAAVLVLTVAAYFAFSRGYKTLGVLAVVIDTVVIAYVAFVQFWAWSTVSIVTRALDHPSVVVKKI